MERPRSVSWCWRNDEVAEVAFQGAAIFGAGWGLGRFCPGPALTSVASGATPVGVFVISMIAAMYLQGLLIRPKW